MQYIDKRDLSTHVATKDMTEDKRKQFFQTELLELEEIKVCLVFLCTLRRCVFLRDVSHGRTVMFFVRNGDKRLCVLVLFANESS